MQTESQTNCTHNADSGQHHDGFDVSFDDGHSFVFGGANVLSSFDYSVSHPRIGWVYLVKLFGVVILVIPPIDKLVYRNECHLLHLYGVVLFEAKFVEEMFF